MLLALAMRDGGLLRSGDAVALHESPQQGSSGAAVASAPTEKPVTHWLHCADRHWDVLVFVSRPLVLLAVAALVAAAGRGAAGSTLGSAVLVLVLPATLWVVGVLVVAVGRMARDLVRRRPAETGLGQLGAHNPTVPLLHARTADAATTFVVRARAAGDGPLLVLAHGITAAAPQHRGPDGLRIESMHGDRRAARSGRRRADPVPTAKTTAPSSATCSAGTQTRTDRNTTDPAGAIYRAAHR